MTDDKKLKNAQNVYKSLCEILDENGVRYEKHIDDMVVSFIMTGEDIPMDIVINVDAERELIRLLSPIRATFEGDKRVEAAVATSQVNFNLADGSFDYDFKNGRVLFRMTSSFIDSLISKEVLEYMIGVAGYSIDEYNDKFLMLAKGILPLKSFFKS